MHVQLTARNKHVRVTAKLHPPRARPSYSSVNGCEMSQKRKHWNWSARVLLRSDRNCVFAHKKSIRAKPSCGWCAAGRHLAPRLYLNHPIFHTFAPKRRKGCAKGCGGCVSAGPSRGQTSPNIPLCYSNSFARRENKTFVVSNQEGLTLIKTFLVICAYNTMSEMIVSALWLELIYNLSCTCTVCPTNDIATLTTIVINWFI